MRTAQEQFAYLYHVTWGEAGTYKLAGLEAARAA